MTLTLEVPFRLTQDVADFAEASAVYAQARDLSGEGCGSFPTGLIERDGRTVATISYNGRVWDTGQVNGRGADRILFDPAQAA